MVIRLIPYLVMLLEWVPGLVAEKCGKLGSQSLGKACLDVFFVGRLRLRYATLGIKSDMLASMSGGPVRKTAP